MLKTPKITRKEKKEQIAQVHHEQPSKFIIDIKKNAANPFNKIHHEETPKIECLFFFRMDALGCPQTEIQLSKNHVAMVSMSVVYKAKIGNVRKAK